MVLLLTYEDQIIAEKASGVLLIFLALFGGDQKYKATIFKPQHVPYLATGLATMKPAASRNVVKWLWLALTLTGKRPEPDIGSTRLDLGSKPKIPDDKRDGLFMALEKCIKSSSDKSTQQYARYKIGAL